MKAITRDYLVDIVYRTINKTIELQVKESDSIMDFITIKAYKFPFINLVWAGTIIMVIGFIISLLHRRKQGRLSAKKNRAVKSNEAAVEV